MKILSELEDYAQNNQIPIIEAESLEFIIKFIKKKKISSILEIGTAIGYSALSMSTQACVKKIISLERNYGYAQIADLNIGRAGKDQVIQVINKDALSYKTSEHFDLLFIDGAKAQYQRFFNRFISNVDYVIVDNMDFHGMVANPGLSTNRNTRAMAKKIAKFRENIENDENFLVKYYNMGDGILLIEKAKEK